MNRLRMVHRATASDYRSLTALTNKSRIKFRAPRSQTPVKTSVGTLGPGGPQFSYGLDYCLWLLELRHDPTNPYDDLGGESG